jgi:DNA-binding transcriptional regulator YiaG
MTPQDIKRLRDDLGLSAADLAALLETDENTVRRMEMRRDTKNARLPARRMTRLMQAYRDGWRPHDWPE